MLLAGRSGSYGSQAASSLAMKLTADGVHAGGFPDRVFAVDRAAQLSLVSGGGFVTAGSIHGSSDNPAATAFSLTAYNSDGSRNDGFARKSRAITEFEGGAEATDLTTTGDGSLLATGTSHAGNDDFALARYSGVGTGQAPAADLPTSQLKVTVLKTGTPSTTAGLVRRGVRVLVRCSQACDARVNLRVSRSTADQLGIGTAIVGISRVRSHGERPFVIFAQLNSWAARALKRSKPGSPPRIESPVQATPLAAGVG